MIVLNIDNMWLWERLFSPDNNLIGNNRMEASGKVFRGQQGQSSERNTLLCKCLTEESRWGRIHSSPRLSQKFMSKGLCRCNSAFM